MTLTLAELIELKKNLESVEANMRENGLWNTDKSWTERKGHVVYICYEPTAEAKLVINRLNRVQKKILKVVDDIQIDD